VSKATRAIPAEAAVLIFDGDCSFCTTSVEYLRRNLPVAPKIEPYQWLDLDSYGLTAADASAQIWLVTPDEQFGGYAALARLLQLQPSPILRFAGYLADTFPFSLASLMLYRTVARNRHLLPGGTPACRMPHA
jgi:predicted DCC family thiol-disulfide oxidoreductase YuxK